jgi:hypothetical protein
MWWVWRDQRRKSLDFLPKILAVQQLEQNEISTAIDRTYDSERTWSGLLKFQLDVIST